MDLLVELAGAWWWLAGSTWPRAATGCAVAVLAGAAVRGCRPT